MTVAVVTRTLPARLPKGHECPAIEVGTGICSRTVTRTLERIIDERGKPQALCCDNGPELMRRRFLGWCEEQNIKLIHIQT